MEICFGDHGPTICAIGFVMLLEQTPLYTANAARFCSTSHGSRHPALKLVLAADHLRHGDDQQPDGDHSLHGASCVAWSSVTISRPGLVSPIAAAHRKRPTRCGSEDRRVSSSSLVAVEDESLAASLRQDDDAVPAGSAPQPQSMAMLFRRRTSVAVKRAEAGLRVSRRSEGDGYVLTISFTSPDPTRAARLR